MTPSRLPPCQSSTPPGSSTRANSARTCRSSAGSAKNPNDVNRLRTALEAAGPARRKRAHVASRVAETRPGAALARALQELARVVEAVDVEAGLGEQVCVASLPARDVEQARAGWKAEDVDQSRDFVPVALERKQRLVLEQVLPVEVALPPFAPLRTLCHPIKISVGGDAQRVILRSEATKDRCPPGSCNSLGARAILRFAQDARAAWLRMTTGQTEHACQAIVQFHAATRSRSASAAASRSHSAEWIGVRRRIGLVASRRADRTSDSVVRREAAGRRHRHGGHLSKSDARADSAAPRHAEAVSRARRTHHRHGAVVRASRSRRRRHSRGAQESRQVLHRDEGLGSRRRR